MSGKIKNTLATILEHGSHAWRALEVAGMAEDNSDGSWPPDTNFPVGSAAYHLAAMLKYTKRLHDELGSLEDSRLPDE
jgi:hypothetical protein